MTPAACPWCGSKNIDAHFVDIGVGMQQVTPYECSCGARQMNPYHEEDNATASAEERACGWWRP